MQCFWLRALCLENVPIPGAFCCLLTLEQFFTAKTFFSSHSSHLILALGCSFLSGNSGPWTQQPWMLFSFPYLAPAARGQNYCHLCLCDCSIHGRQNLLNFASKPTKLQGLRRIYSAEPKGEEQKNFLHSLGRCISPGCTMSGTANSFTVLSRLLLFTISKEQQDGLCPSSFCWCLPFLSHLLLDICPFCVFIT